MKLPGYRFNLIELSTPVLMILWAMWFFLFDPLNVSNTYRFLIVFPNLLWAVIFVTVGVVKAYSILYGNYILRRTSAAISVCLWLLMTAIFAAGNYHSHLVPTCFFFAYQSVLSWHRITPQK